MNRLFEEIKFFFKRQDYEISKVRENGNSNSLVVGGLSHRRVRIISRFRISFCGELFDIQIDIIGSDGDMRKKVSKTVRQSSINSEYILYLYSELLWKLDLMF